jgi:hypothetical protein
MAGDTGRGYKSHGTRWQRFHGDIALTILETTFTVWYFMMSCLEKVSIERAKNK